MNIIESEVPASVILGHFIHIQKNVIIGANTRISNFSNLYGCTIGSNCLVGAYTEIQNDTIIKDKTRISSHSFICSKVTIGESCFIGHGVMFTNDVFKNNKVNFERSEWKETTIGNNVLIGSNSTILPVKIGDNCIVGAGSVVTKDIPPFSVVAGNPAKIIRSIK